jgi:hypothetical protein
MKFEEIICYVEYTHKGISLYKVNDFDNKSYITIDKSALIKMIEDEHNETDMDLEVLIHYHYGKFSDEQLNRVLTKVKEIIKTNDVYKDYCNVKDIIFV